MICSCALIFNDFLLLLKLLEREVVLVNCWVDNEYGYGLASCKISDCECYNLYVLELINSVDNILFSDDSWKIKERLSLILVY